MTFAFEKRMIAMLGECSLSGVKRLSGITWDQAWAVVDRAVDRGLSRIQKKLHVVS